MQPRACGVHGAIVFLLCVVCAVGGLAVGCVGGMGLASAPDPTSSPKAVAASETSTSEAPASTEPSTSPSDSPPPTPSKSSPSPTPKIRVPNVVGKNHQEAQDIMQRAGLWGLAEEDATGQGRMLVFDRNWQVVRQSPKAGTMVSPDETITLYSKKIGE